MLPISRIVYSGRAWIRDDPNPGRIAASSGVDALVNGGHEHAKVQGDGGQLQHTKEEKNLSVRSPKIRDRSIYRGRDISRNARLILAASHTRSKSVSAR